MVHTGIWIAYTEYELYTREYQIKVIVIILPTLYSNTACTFQVMSFGVQNLSNQAIHDMFINDFWIAVTKSPVD